jgi:Flp pilus assembly protein TadD
MKVRQFGAAVATAFIMLAVAPAAHAACASGEAIQEPARRARADAALIARIMSEADQALAGRRFDDACVKYRLILSVDRDNEAARIGLGEGALGQADSASARAHFQAALNGGASNPIAHQGMGLAHLIAGDMAAADSELRTAVGADASLWRAWNGLGVISDSRAEWETADAAWAAAIAAAPGEASIYNNKGMSLMQRGSPGLAVPAFDEALRLMPNLATAASNRRIALAMTGAYDTALAGVSEADLPAALNNVAIAAARRGDTAVADRLLAAAVTASPRYYEVAERNRDLLRSSH